MWVALLPKKDVTTMSLKIDQIVGSRLRKHRRRASVSVDRAAFECHLSVLEYETRECGEVRFTASELFLLCRLFGVNMADLFSSLDDRSSLQPKHCQRIDGLKKA